MARVEGLRVAERGWLHEKRRRELLLEDLEHTEDLSHILIGGILVLSKSLNRRINGGAC